MAYALASRGAVLLASLCLAGSAAARVWHVPKDAPTIQAGIDAAAAGDTVLIACGIYYEHDLQLKAAIWLRSATGRPDCVTIDAAQAGRVIDCSNLKRRAHLEGLTLRGGLVSEGWLEAAGGGIRALDSDLRVADCTLTGNQARIGGGIGINRSTVTIERCVFLANHAVDSDWAAGGAVWSRQTSGEVKSCTFALNEAFADDPASPGDGGGVFCNNTTLSFRDCHFLGNRAGAGAGGFYAVSSDAAILVRCHFEANEAAWGGAAYLEYTVTTAFADCEFRGNRARSGGALLISDESAPLLAECRFEANTATYSGGGAVQSFGSSPIFQQCVFLANSCAGSGGAINAQGGQYLVRNSLFHLNQAGQGGGALRVRSASFMLESSTLVANAAAAGAGLMAERNAVLLVDHSLIVFSTQGAAAAVQDNGALTFMCCDLFGNQGGDWTAPFGDQFGQAGNISADPCFIAPQAGDFHLKLGSPCRPSATSSCGLMGAFQIVCDAGDAFAAPLAVHIFPNPFNSATVIGYDLPDPGGPCRLTVYGLDGRLVRVLVDEILPPGWHTVRWDGRDDRAIALASGIYLCHLEAAGRQTIRKLSLVK